jgi:hypothetical protein
MHLVRNRNLTHSLLLLPLLLLLLQIRRVIPNPTIKHNFSQLLARAEGDRAQVGQ